MHIIRPTRGKDLRVWVWSELSGFTKGLLAAVPVLLILVGLVIVPGLQHSTGTYSEIEGIVRSVGPYNVGGGALHGRTAIIAVVILSDGKVVQAAIRSGLQIDNGTKVIVREFPQNFGHPRYGIYSVSQAAAR